VSCASTGGQGARGGKELNRAVESFIAGDFQDAVRRLEELAPKTDSEEELREVYYYLGRSYLVLEEYHRAIDAFTTGKAVGGGSVFDEYLLRLDFVVSGAPDAVTRSEKVTRGQFAALIDRMFYAAAVDTSLAGGGASGLAGLVSVERGGVQPMPDGKLHTEAYVTRGAFYATVARLVRERDASLDPESLFENGYQWALTAPDEESNFVTGREVVDTLQRVADAIEKDNG